MLICFHVDQMKEHKYCEEIPTSLIKVLKKNTMSKILFLLDEKKIKLDNSNFQSTTGIWYGFLIEEMLKYGYMILIKMQ